MAKIEVSLYRKDDGDGLARFKVIAENDSFSGGTLVWGYAESFEELASELTGFPQTVSSIVTKQLGSPSAGLSELNFFCLDGSGHAVAWIKMEAEYPVHPTSNHESISMCVRVEPAAIDAFSSELRSLAAGKTEKATLYGS